MTSTTDSNRLISEVGRLSRFGSVLPTTWPSDTVVSMSLHLFSGLLWLLLLTLADQRVGGSNRIDKNIHDGHQNLNEKDDGGIWSMVASMQSTGHESGPTSLSQDGTHTWRLPLDESRQIWLDWSTNYEQNRIDFAVTLDTGLSGFEPGKDMLAIGFSEDGRLEASDFCLAWYDLSHSLHLEDAKVDSNSILHLVGDESESFCRLSSKRARGASTRRHQQFGGDHHQVHNESMVTIAFSRPLDTCDGIEGGINQRVGPLGGSRFYTIDNGTTNLVWFSLPGPLLYIEGQNLTGLVEHSANGSLSAESRKASWGLKRVQLIRARQERGPEMSSSSSSKSLAHSRHQSFHLRMDKYQIPAQETTYWCKLLKLPDKFGWRRFHITRYEAAIESGREHIVHHMELFSCAPQFEADLRRRWSQTGGWQGDCNSADRPPELQSCKKVILAWAMGARPMEYPEQVGQSIGGQGTSLYVVLEVHYNNLAGQSGLLDSSGLRFEYTHKLRQYDAGILEVGLEYSDKNSIPPGLVAPLAGYCHGECTRAAMLLQQVGGIYVFAGQLHTHLTGVSSWTELLRPGKQVVELQRDDHYSAHFQEIRLFDEPRLVLPGDTLAHYCLYDTRARANITLGGFSTSDEMCVTYLHYYPRIELEVCKSSVDSRALESYFAYLARFEDQQTSEQLAELARDERRGRSGRQTSKINDLAGEEGANLDAIWPPSPRESPTNKRAGLGDGAAGPAEVHQRGLEIEPKAAGQQAAKSVAQNYRAIEWSQRRSLELLQFYAQAPLSIQCNRSDGNRLGPGSWEGIQVPRPQVSSFLSRSNRQPEEEEEQGAERGPRESGKIAAATASEPLQWWRWPSPTGSQLASYRGRGFGRRHAQCRQFGAQQIGQLDR